MEQKTLERLCLFKVQMDRRALKGRANKDSQYYKCRGYDLTCDNYIRFKQRNLYNLNYGTR